MSNTPDRPTSPLARTLVALLALLLIASLFVGPRSVEPAAASAPDATAIDPRAVDDVVTRLMAENRIPGVAVVLVQDGRVVYQQGYGEAAPGRPVTPETQFYMGSLTKSFTALAALQLVEQGRLELDAPVQRYLPWFAVADADASARITVRHLLNQTSGLGAAGDPRSGEYFPTLEDGVRALKDARPTAPVGERFQYYNQNYRVLGLLIEKASGKPYGDYLRESVLAPLGMSRTTANPAEATDLALGHGQFFGLPLPRTQEFRPSALPSGYLMTSADDLGRYMVALLDATPTDGVRAGDSRLLKAESLALLQNPPSGAAGYGMGWAISNQAEGKIVYHDGALENYYGQIILLPERRAGVAFLTNEYGMLQLLNGFRGLQSELGDVVLGAEVVPLKSFTWAAYLLGLVAALDLANNVRRLVTLPRWARRAAKRPPVLRWALALADLAPPVAALVGLPIIVSSILKESGDWSTMFGVLPDVTAWILAGIAFGIVRGGAKLVILARRPRGEVVG